MLELEKWAKDRNPFLALVAVHLVMLTRLIADDFSAPDKRTHQFNGVVPPLPRWFSLYRSHRTYSEAVLELIATGSEYGKAVLPLIAGFHELSSLKDDQLTFQLTAADLQESQSYLEQLHKLSFAEIRNVINDTQLEYEIHERVGQFVSQNLTELTFAFTIALPCWFFYQTTPTQLYRKARQGNVAAIKKLLKLDPFALHNHAIGSRIQEVRLKGKRVVYRQLLEAATSPIKPKLSKKGIKSSAAALLSTLAQIFNEPLTEPEIKKLYDAAAKDIDKRLIDSSVADRPDARSRAILRNRSAWENSMYQTDKSGNVSG